MAILAISVVICISLSFLIFPLIKNVRGGIGAPSIIAKLSELERREQRALEEIQTLTLDHSLGNVADDEYEKKLSSGRLDAGRMIHEREQYEKVLSDLDDHIEFEVLELRIASGRVHGVGSCSSCSCRIDLEAMICPKCFFYQDESTPYGEAV